MSTRLYTMLEDKGSVGGVLESSSELLYIDLYITFI